MATSEEIAWAAGLFEGEGSIFVARQVSNKGKVYEYPRLELKMTDEDVVMRFRDILGAGKVYSKPDKKYKDAWCYSLTDVEKIEEIIKLFWPYLGKRRKQAAIAADVEPLWSKA